MNVNCIAVKGADRNLMQSRNDMPCMGYDERAYGHPARAGTCHAGKSRLWLNPVWRTFEVYEDAGAEAASGLSNRGSTRGNFRDCSMALTCRPMGTTSK